MPRRRRGAATDQIVLQREKDFAPTVVTVLDGRRQILLQDAHGLLGLILCGAAHAEIGEVFHDA